MIVEGKFKLTSPRLRKVSHNKFALALDMLSSEGFILKFLKSVSLMALLQRPKMFKFFVRLDC